MIYILLSLMLILPTLLGIGGLASQKIKLWDGISSDLVMGIVSISIVWTALAFFIPINTAVEIPTLLLGISLFIYQRKYRALGSFLREHYRIFVPVLFIILFFGAFYPFILDHFGYYVPSIKWIREVGMPRGISNLDLLLGQMSIWHIFQAGFSNLSDTFLRMNSLMLAGYLIYILERRVFVHLLFFPILFLFVQSPSADLPVIILSMLVLNETMRSNTNAKGLFLLSVFVFIIKPTAIWVPVFVFLYNLFCLKQKPLSWMPAGIALGLLFCFKNIWLFGYPIFPVAVIDLNLPWKPNPELLKNSAMIAIMKTYNLQYTYAEIHSFSKWDYIKNWLLLEGIKGKIHILFIISLMILCFHTFISRKKVLYLLCGAVLLKSAMVLAFSAQYRFFLEVFFVMIFILTYQKAGKKTAILGFTVMTLAIAFVLSTPQWLQKQLPSFYLGYFMGGFNENQWLKPSEYQLNQYKSHKVGNLEFYLSAEDYPFMFDTPLPTISNGFLKDYLRLGIFPQWDSERKKNGFHWKKLTPKEIQELKKAISLKQ